VSETCVQIAIAAIREDNAHKLEEALLGGLGYDAVIDLQEDILEMDLREDIPEDSNHTLIHWCATFDSVKCAKVRTFPFQK